MPLDRDRGAMQQIADNISAKMQNQSISLYDKETLDEIKKMRSDMNALLTSIKITWNERELARLIASLS